MARRLLGGGHEVVGWDLSANEVAAAVAGGAEGAGSLQALVDALDPPRVVWIMVPHGAPTLATIEALLPLLRKGDVIVDGGNSRWIESMEAAAAARDVGVGFLDVGVSGGVWGLERGYCLMVGGDREAVEAVEPAFETLAAEGGWSHVGPSGAGHFVKMVHNAIEYVMLQALGEGFECLQASDFDLDLRGIAELWGHGSVVRGWLLELLEGALAAEGNDLADVAPFVDDSGTGRWTVDFALGKGVPVPAVALALFERFDSRTEDRFAHRTIAALRRQFGGHAVKEV